jgi:hypothetical protein
MGYIDRERLLALAADWVAANTGIIFGHLPGILELLLKRNG